MKINWPKCSNLNIYKNNAGYFCRVTFDNKIETVTKTKIKLKGILGGPSQFEKIAELEAYKSLRSILGFRTDNIPVEQYFLFEYLKSELGNKYLVESDYKFLANRKYEIDIAIRKKDFSLKGIGIEVNGGIMQKFSGHSSYHVLKDYKKYEIMMINGWLPYIVTPTQAQKDYKEIAEIIILLIKKWF